jgi:transposase
MNSRAFVGLDVNKKGIRAMVRPTGEQWQVVCDDSGITEIADRLSAVRPEVIVMEAQGGLELPVAGTLATVGLPLALVSPRTVREFARAIGRIRGDYDHAELLVHFAELVKPEATPLPKGLVEQLKAVRSRRQEVATMLVMERSRQNSDVAAVHRDVRNHIFYLERCSLSLGEEINRLVRSSSIWR